MNPPSEHHGGTDSHPTGGGTTLPSQPREAGTAPAMPGSTAEGKPPEARHRWSSGLRPPLPSPLSGRGSFLQNCCSGNLFFPLLLRTALLSGESCQGPMPLCPPAASLFGLALAVAGPVRRPPGAAAPAACRPQTRDRPSRRPATPDATAARACR